MNQFGVKENNMDLFKFINSRDVRNYLESINYQFDTIKAAWIVWQSELTTIAERHQAWEEIISTMPDCEIEKRLNAIARNSLHDYLRELIFIENREIQKIKRCEDGTSYEYIAFDEHNEEVYHDIVDNFDLCFEICKERGQDISRIKIIKHWSDSDRKDVEIKFDKNKSAMQIIAYEGLDDYESDIVFCGFDGMWFYFPTPFKKGDIVRTDLFSDDAFVFEELGCEGHIERYEKNGDISDMTAYGYFVNEDDGDIYYENIYNYMNIEYYRGKLSGINRMLKAISSLMLDKIPLDNYSFAYRKVLADLYAEKLDKQKHGYDEEQLELMGLKDDY